MQCPRCSSAHIVAFRSVYEHGTSNSRSLSLGSIVGQGSQGLQSAGMFGSVFGSSQSEAAKRCAPPLRTKAPGGSLEIGIVIFGVLIMIPCGLSSLVSESPAGVIIGLFFVVMTSWVSWLMSQERKKSQRLLDVQHAEQISVWQRKLLCMACSHDFELPSELNKSDGKSSMGHTDTSTS
jgi:hypothetical protein